MIAKLGVVACLLAPTAALAELPQWLAGEWERESRGGTVVERWSVVSERTMEGESWRVGSDGSRLVTEQLLIAEMVDGLFLIPRPAENPTPVVFSLVEQGERRVVFANPQHDFPQQIGYELQGETLTAWISDGGEQRIDFVFTRRAPATASWGLDSGCATRHRRDRDGPLAGP